MHRLERALAEVSGMDAVSLQPAAGAQGELAGIMMVRAYHAQRGERRRKVLVPESAHGTNPASAALNGYEIVPIPAGEDGVLHPATVAGAMDEQVAALMMTNPNTLGIFERHIAAVCEVVHAKGGLVYGDGANLNAMLGVTRPGDQGIDVMHFNLHKTFSTPHGGGGPGAGPVGVKAALAPFLPVPVVRERPGGGYELRDDLPHSIGRLHGNHGNVGMLVRAYAYIRSLGPEGLRRCAEMAVLNANYLLARLRDRWHVPFDQPVMHECVLSDRGLADTGVTTIDVAKRLIDYGYHPPTIYFPLVVHGALMIEPTESETPRGARPLRRRAAPGDRRGGAHRPGAGPHRPPPHPPRAPRRDPRRPPPRAAMAARRAVLLLLSALALGPGCALRGKEAGSTSARSPGCRRTTSASSASRSTRRSRRSSH